MPAPGIGNRTYAEPLWVGGYPFIGFLDLNQRVTTSRTEPNPNLPAGGPNWIPEGRPSTRPEAGPGRPAMGVVMPGPRGWRRGAVWGRRGHLPGPMACPAPAPPAPAPRHLRAATSASASPCSRPRPCLTVRQQCERCCRPRSVGQLTQTATSGRWCRAADWHLISPASVVPRSVRSLRNLRRLRSDSD